MKPEDVLNQIWAMRQTYRILYPDDQSTHVLLHPQLEHELYQWHEQIAYLNPGSPIDRKKRTIFDMPIITVHNKPYPYIGLAKVISNEQPG